MTQIAIPLVLLIAGFLLGRYFRNGSGKKK